MSIEWSWCPQCKKWVPASLMNRDFDEETGQLIRMCTPCMEGEESSYVEDPEHETVQCIYCDSADTTELAPQWNKYRCNACGETFRRFLY